VRLLLLGDCTSGRLELPPGFRRALSQKALVRTCRRAMAMPHSDAGRVLSVEPASPHGADRASKAQVGAGRRRSGPHARIVAIGVVRSERSQIVKALARDPPGTAGLRLLQQCSVAAARGRFSGNAAARMSTMPGSPPRSRSCTGGHGILNRWGRPDEASRAGIRGCGRRRGPYGVQLSRAGVTWSSWVMARGLCPAR
jgi:hypothetical protein